MDQGLVLLETYVFYDGTTGRRSMRSCVRTASKGRYLKKVTVSTHGRAGHPGRPVDYAEFRRGISGLAAVVARGRPMSDPSPVNHHADHPGFSGVVGGLIGLSMLVTGRTNAWLAAELAGMSSGDDVVDIGCGPGTAVTLAAGRGARVTGADPAPVMLQLARIFTCDRQRVRWRQGCAEELPAPDHSATVVWSLATVHH